MLCLPKNQQKMDTYKFPQKQEWSKIFKRPSEDNESVKQAVSKILNQVKKDGDKALKELTRRFDGATVKNLLVSKSEFEAAEKQVASPLKNALEVAKKNIHKFHKSQEEETKYIETIHGVECWRKSVPIEKVGLYIPGGTAPLFSTVLMLAIPAKIAGCKEIVLCTPPDKEGKIHPAILHTAAKTGIKKIYKVGGAQAIAAMAYGTETIPKVFKIFGPGNQYVTIAKQLVSIEGIAIDMPAGPSELMIVSDESTDVDVIAADFLSQAEHGIDSQSILITFSDKMLDKLNEAIEIQLDELPRKKIAEKSLEHSRIVIVKDPAEAVEIINEYAPEHLIISTKNEGYYIDRIINTGSVFLGQYTPETAGDYASGTNHTLPTNGHAKVYSGISLDSFIKKITFQRINRDALLDFGSTLEVMAAAEELEAHKNAVSIRLKKIRDSRVSEDD